MTAALARADVPWRKIASAAAVLVLHVVIAALLLRATFAPPHVASAVRETILYLIQPKPPKKKEVAPKKPAPAVAGSHALDYRGYFVPQAGGVESAAPGAPLELLDCRPENLMNLTPEQRTRCAAPGPSHAPDYADHSKEIPGAARWARELKRKQAPALLPCASNLGLAVGIGTLVCLGKGLADGFDMNDQPVYGDRPEEHHVPNNGDPHPSYVDPDH